LFFKSTIQTFWAHRSELLKRLVHLILLGKSELISFLDINDKPTTYDCKDWIEALKVSLGGYKTKSNHLLIVLK